jgi:molybdopterin adenylyltransferase
MITVAVLTMSDKGSRGEREDISGPLIRDMLKAINAEVKFYDILPDDKELIKRKLIEYSGKVDMVLTTGGTGLSPRDVTPEATLEVVDRQVPGIAEAMRSEGLRKTKGAMIINFPGSPVATKENLAVILEVIPHAIEKIKGDLSECARQSD